MKRKIFMIIAIIASIAILTICLVSCGNTENNYGFNIPGANLVCIGTSSTSNSGWYALYYDKDTKVMYMFVKHGYGAGLTPLYNADGTLKLYEQENE